MGIALFHLLPESVENIEEYFEDEPDSLWKKLPISFFLAFIAYSLILFVEKVAFDSHALIEHEHEEGHGHSHDNKNVHDEKEMKSQKGKSELKEKLVDDKKEDSGSESSDSDVEEDTIRNVVSSRGKFASFLHMRNSIIEKQTKSFVENQQPQSHKKDKALTRASILLQKTLSKSFRDQENEDLQFLVNPQNVHVDEKDEKHVEHDFKPKSNLTPFLLLVALSLHGFFEGIALGIQGGVRDTLFLFIAIVSHKWAEAFTLVNIIF